MSDKPILFSAPMVRALLAGTKTQTRRLIPLPGLSAPVLDFVKVATDKTGRAVYEMKGDGGKSVTIKAGKHFVSPTWSPRIAVGDRLYVREAWRVGYEFEGSKPSVLAPNAMPVLYEAEAPHSMPWEGRLRPGMHMPRWASRLTLTVTDVRVQRLQDISGEDALAEGVVTFFRESGRLDWPAAAPGDVVAAASELLGGGGAVAMYRDLWNAINGPDSWDANPWVAAYTFTVERGNIDQLVRAAA